MRFNRSDWLILSLVAAATLGLFRQSIGFDFIHYDDPEYVFMNDHVKHGLTWENVRFAFTSRTLGHWHPLTWLSYMLDAQFSGLDPSAFHRTSVVLHACSAVSLYLVLRAMTAARWRSALATALFALHPLRVESVAWVAERKDVLSMFFGLLALLAYVNYSKRKTTAMYVAVLLLFASSLLSKSMLLTLPFVMLLVDYWPLRRFGTERGSRLIVEKLPLFVMTSASATMQIITARGVGALNPASQIPLWPRVSNAIVSTAHYLFDMIWPTRLTLLYPFPAQPQPIAALTVGILLVTITVACVVWLRRWPHLAVGWFWFLGTLVPVNGLISIGEIARADRYTYFSTIGLILMVIWSIPEFTGRSARAVAVALSFIVLLALSLVAHVQLQHWKTSDTVFDHALWVIGPHATIEMNWGVALAARRQHADAAVHLRKAWELAPGNPAVIANLANELQASGQLQESVEMYRNALHQLPEHPMIWHNLGVAYMRMRQLYDAEECFRQVLRLRPTFEPARQNLNRVLRGQGKPPE